MSDLAVLVTKFDLLQAQVAKLSEVISQMAVQEVKISALAVEVARIQTEHEKCRSGCQIHTALADIRWIKWFVMGNSTAVTAMVIGFITHYVKSGAA